MPSWSRAPFALTNLGLSSPWNFSTLEPDNTDAPNEGNCSQLQRQLWKAGLGELEEEGLGADSLVRSSESPLTPSQHQSKLETRRQLPTPIMTDRPSDSAPDLRILGDEITLQPSGFVEPPKRTRDEGKEQLLMENFARFRSEPLQCVILPSSPP